MRVDGSRRATLRNRKFVRPLHPNLKRPITNNPQPFEENVMVPAHPARHAPAVEDHLPVSQRDGDAGPDPDPVPVPVVAPQQVPTNEAAAETLDRGDHDRGDHDAVQRPRRSPKPNPKYSPEVYDLDYVGSRRKRSRRSIRRAAK